MITFLNTDLDVVSDRDPTPLVAALCRDGRVHPLTQPPRARDDGTWFVNFETFADPQTPEATAADLIGAVEALGGEDQALWDACRSRVLDFGYESGDGKSQGFELSPSLVARAAAVGLAIRVTIYPPYDEATASSSPSASGSRSSA